MNKAFKSIKQYFLYFFLENIEKCIVIWSYFINVTNLYRGVPVIRSVTIRKVDFLITFLINRPPVKKKLTYTFFIYYMTEMKYILSNILRLIYCKKTWDVSKLLHFLS